MRENIKCEFCKTYQGKNGLPCMIQIIQGFCKFKKIIVDSDSSKDEKEKEKKKDQQNLQQNIITQETEQQLQNLDITEDQEDQNKDLDHDIDIEDALDFIG